MAISTYSRDWNMMSGAWRTTYPLASTLLFALYLGVDSLVFLGAAFSSMYRRVLSYTLGGGFCSTIAVAYSLLDPRAIGDYSFVGLFFWASRKHVVTMRVGAHAWCGGRETI